MIASMHATDTHRREREAKKIVKRQVPEGNRREMDEMNSREKNQATGRCRRVKCDEMK